MSSSRLRYPSAIAVVPTTSESANELPARSLMASVGDVTAMMLPVVRVALASSSLMVRVFLSADRVKVAPVRLRPVSSGL